jgi:hypothetical protein
MLMGPAAGNVLAVKRQEVGWRAGEDRPGANNSESPYYGSLVTRT